VPHLTWTALPPSYQLQGVDVVEPWLAMEHDFPVTATYLRLKVTGTWVAFAGMRECGPDGSVGQSFPEDQLFVPDCAVGAIVGRLGGSSAVLKAQSPDADAGQSKPFAVGSLVVVKFPDKFVGPLFLGFNILRRPVKVTSLKVDIEFGN
jgi:hypothetical protein